MSAPSVPPAPAHGDRVLLQGFARSMRDNAFGEVAVQLTRGGSGSLRSAGQLPFGFTNVAGK